MRPTWRVFHGGTTIAVVTADRVFLETGGNLKFYNRAVDERYGTTVAAFAPGHWSHFNMVGEN